MEFDQSGSLFEHISIYNENLTRHRIHVYVESVREISKYLDLKSQRKCHTSKGIQPQLFTNTFKFRFVSSA